MATVAAKDESQIDAIRGLIGELSDKLDIDASVRLWDDSTVPLGRNVSGPLEIVITSPGTVGSLLRWPTLDNVIRHYIEKKVDITGGSLLDLGRMVDARPRGAARLTNAEMLRLGRRLTPFLFTAPDKADVNEGFSGDIKGESRSRKDNKDYIQFHYDLSNDFYALFLDPEMVYSCAYFTDWTNGIEQAQRDKLEMICRKLRLKKGERMLDVGAGWGGLLCHAAREYGIVGHGITLSEEQLAYAREKASREGLADRLTFELADYSVVTGSYDKIASIGMYEHIGRKYRAAYFQKMRSLLTEDGLFLNHAISRRALKPRILPRRLRPEQKAILKYIFPGGELDDIGSTIFEMERAGFEVQDVEAWRMHYARTTELWHRRLEARAEDARAHVSEEKLRIWHAYLAGVSLAFSRGTMRLYQTLVSKTPKRPPPLPPTRADLYR